MSLRLWGACASEQGLLESALGPERLSLRLTETKENPVGWGIGFYEGGEPLIRKSPKEERSEIDLLGVVAETRSDLLIGHVREPTVGPLRAENTHPFRFRHWLFAHSGTIRRFAEIKHQLVNALPTFLTRSLGGETDSEVLFHLVLSFLHDARKLDNPRLDAQSVGEALMKAIVMVDELEKSSNGEEASSFNILLTNGNCLVALRRNPLALYYRHYEAPGRNKVKPRAVIVACERTAVGEGWTPLSERSIIRIERNLEVETDEF